MKRAEDILNNCFNSKPIDQENPDGVSLACVPIPEDFPWDKMMGLIKKSGFYKE